MRGVAGGATAFLAAPQTGKPLGLAAPTAILARTGSGRRSGVGSGAGGAPFFVVSPGSGARRTTSLWDGVGVRIGQTG